MNNQFIVALESRRLLSGGALDPSFAAAPVDIPGGAEEARNVIVDSSGRILAAGQWEDVSTQTSGISLVRYLPDGSLDPRFGDNGQEVISPHGLRNIHGIHRMSDGRLLLVGDINPPNKSVVAITRLSASGKVDRSFGNDGIVKVPFPTTPASGSVSVDFTNTDLVVIGGSIYGGVTQVGVELMRFDSEGHADIFLGNQGIAKVFLNVQDGNDVHQHSQVQSIHVRSDGSIDVGFLIAKSLGDPAVDDPQSRAHVAGVTRLRSDGTVINSYGTNGLAQMSFAYGLPTGEFPNPLFAHNPDGTAQVLFADGGGESVVYSFTASGEDDVGFSGDPTSGPPYRQTSDFTDSLDALARQADGKWVAAGNAGTGGAVLWRFNNDFTPDTTFGTDGRDVVDSSSDSQLADVAIAADRSIVTAGLQDFSIDSKYLVARVLPDAGPIGLLGARNVTEGTTLSNKFKVFWHGDEPIDETTLGRDDLDIISPDGTHFTAAFVGSEPLAGGAQATYKLAAPGGQWDSSDGGIWTVAANANGVRDTGGDGSNAVELGTFQVSV